MLLILGAAAAGATTFLELTSMFVFGPLLIASGVIQVLVAFLMENRKEAILHLAASGIEALFGLYVMAQPLQATVSLAMVAAVFLLCIAAVRLVRSLISPTPGRAWFALAGVAALLLAVSLSVGWPGAGPWFVGLCIALDLACHGLSWSGLAWAERNPFAIDSSHPP
ncbi:MAG: DUF308 domain-containing protein [Gemmataceae bacterium]